MAFARCKALIFPGGEDYGIIPVEILASGRPIIGLAKGGLLDIFGDANVGVFLKEDSKKVYRSVLMFLKEPNNYTDACIERSKNFSKEIFINEFSSIVKKGHELVSFFVFFNDHK